MDEIVGSSVIIETLGKGATCVVLTQGDVETFRNSFGTCRQYHVVVGGVVVNIDTAEEYNALTNIVDDVEKYGKYKADVQQLKVINKYCEDNGIETDETGLGDLIIHHHATALKSIARHEYTLGKKNNMLAEERKEVSRLNGLLTTMTNHRDDANKEIDRLAKCVAIPADTDHELHMCKMLLRMMRGEPVEIKCNSGWFNECKPVLDVNREYREPVKQLVIPWDIIKPEYVFAAMDEKGRVVVGEERFDFDGWQLTYGGMSTVLYGIIIDTDGIDWKQSLVQRPS